MRLGKPPLESGPRLLFLSLRSSAGYLYLGSSLEEKPVMAPLKGPRGRAPAFCLGGGGGARVSVNAPRMRTEGGLVVVCGGG